MWRNNKPSLFKWSTPPRWKVVRRSQTIFSAILLVLVISLPVYYSWPTPSKAKPVASKLMIKIYAITEDRLAAIVSAVDESGQLDNSRDDVINLFFEGASSNEIAQSRVSLKNGEVSVEIKVKNQQTSFLTAKWVSGPTPLKDVTSLVSPLMWNY
jgi:hypothetical protein